uniref:Glycine cleavage system P-protein N-terminal domain-containing protein n=1 Tax=Rhodnius prolixus TaxID=13249 RepID=T1I6Z3_RHOPR
MDFTHGASSLNRIAGVTRQSIRKYAVTLGSKDMFYRRHIGPREEDQRVMLDLVGCKSLDELSDRAIPEKIRLKKPLDMEEPIESVQTGHNQRISKPKLWIPTLCLAKSRSKQARVIRCSGCFFYERLVWSFRKSNRPILLQRELNWCKVSNFFKRHFASYA